MIPPVYAWDSFYFAGPILIRRNIYTAIFKFNLIKSGVRVRLGLKLRFLLLYFTGFIVIRPAPVWKLQNTTGPWTQVKMARVCRRSHNSVLWIISGWQSFSTARAVVSFAAGSVALVNVVFAGAALILCRQQLWNTPCCRWGRIVL